jgi:hypothetical protein
MKVKILRPVFKCQQDQEICFHRLLQVIGFEGAVQSEVKIVVAIASE